MTIQKYYYEQLYDNKMDNLEVMDRFSEKFNLLRVNQEEMEYYEQLNNKHWNWSCDKKSPPKKAQDHGFIGEFCQTFREELMLILLKLFQKITEEGTHPNIFYKATITLIPKPDKNNTKK